MTKLTTFEDIFNKIIDDFQGKEVKIRAQKDGLNIFTLITEIERVFIEPLRKNEKNSHTGLIIIENKQNQSKTSINIPFKLGYDTMEAIFLQNGATIKTLDMKFSIISQT